MEGIINSEQSQMPKMADNKIITNSATLTFFDDYILKEYNGGMVDNKIFELSSMKHELEMNSKFQGTHKLEPYDITDNSYKIKRCKFALGDEKYVFEDNIRRILFSMSYEQIIKCFDEIINDLQTSKLKFRDIHPGNLLYDEKTRDIKLIDFFWTIEEGHEQDIGTLESYNRFYGNDDKEAIDKIKMHIGYIANKVGLEIQEVKEKLLKNSGKDCHDGSFVGLGRVYHYIDIPGFEDVPYYHKNAEGEYQIIKSRLDNPKSLLEIGPNTGYITFNMIRDYFLDKVVVYENDPEINEFLCDVKIIFELKELEVRGEFEKIDSYYDVILALNVLHWIEKEKGPLELIKIIRNLICFSKELFIQIAGTESNPGGYRVMWLKNENDFNSMFSLFDDSNPELLNTTKKHGGKRYLYKII